MRYLSTAFVALVALGAAATMQPAAAQADNAEFAYIGTYTRNAPGDVKGPTGSEGIYVAKVDPETGALERIQTVISDNPSFLALSPDQQNLYAINEIIDYEGEEKGSAEAYSIDPESGEITLINRVALPGPIPAHLVVDPTGNYLVVALYVGGSYVVLPIEEDGSLGEAVDELVQEGSGPNEQRQTSPHPHAVTYDPAQSYIATADLGIDKVEILELTDDGKLERVSEIATEPGAGPRHVAFNPEGTMLYVINELNATILALPYDAETGKLGEAVANVSTVPDDFPSHKSTAEIMVHPSGNFLYGSNRRFEEHEVADSIAVFKLDENGIPERIQLVTENIAFPRAFQIDPTGTSLYVLNQKGDTIVQHEIDQETGELIPTGHIAEFPTPSSLVFTTSE